MAGRRGPDGAGRHADWLAGALPAARIRSWLGDGHVSLLFGHLDELVGELATMAGVRNG